LFHDEKVRALDVHQRPQEQVPSSDVSASMQPVQTIPRGGEAEPVARVTIPEGRPKGIVHFIGGAVVGAAPQLSYKYATPCPWTSTAFPVFHRLYAFNESILVQILH
jgi:hypothetical protein